MSVFGRSRGPWGSSLAAWEASGGVRRGPGRPPEATVCVADSTETRVNKQVLVRESSLPTCLTHLLADLPTCLPNAC